MPFSTIYANNILNFIFGKTDSVIAPKKVFLGLSVNDPEASGGSFSELAGDTYQRICVSEFGATYPDYMGEASNREIKNTKQINWTKAKSDWPPVNGFGLFEAEKGGTPFFYGKLELSAKQNSSGGVICEKDAVMLFDPDNLKISFPKKDSAAGTIIFALQALGDFVEEASMGAYMYTESPAPFSLVAGAKYTVTWDGSEYICEAKEGTLGVNSGIFIGNTKYSEVDGDGNPEDSLEPFMIGYDPASGQLLILADDDKTTHSVVIYKND